MDRELDFSPSTALGFLRNGAIRLNEHATKRFWQYFFVNHVFRGPQWIVSSEQPPVEYNSPRRINLVVELFREDQADVLLYVEGKKGQAKPSDILEVETQGYTACFEHMSIQERNAIWAMTVFGPKARLWICREDKESDEISQGRLEPVFPLINEHGDGAAYVDILGNEEAFMEIFQFMIENPIPDPKIDIEKVFGAQVWR